MKKWVIQILLALIYISVIAQPASEKLNKILDDISTFVSNEFPGLTDTSDYPLGRYTEVDFRRRQDFYQLQLSKLKSLNPDDLTFSEQISLDLMTFSLSNRISEIETGHYLNPILSDAGFHVDFAYRSGRVLASAAACDGYIRSLYAFPTYVDQHIELMKRGLSAGISQPRFILNGYEGTWEKHIVKDPTESVFYQPFKTKPESISEENWKIWQEKAKLAIQTSVIPSYIKVKNFFETIYIPTTRETVGVLHFPNGKAYYEQRAAYFTTTDMTVDQIHRTGMQEVIRLENEMKKIMKEVGFNGDLKAFIDTLRSDPQFYAKTPEALLKEAAWLTKKAEAGLPALFGKLPRQPCGVAPVPDYLAPTYTGGRYIGADINGPTPGYYWVNTYNLASRPLYILPALTLHEALPGHHLQIALTQELDLPEFRKNLYINVFGEGWGLYSEYLGEEMGMYPDPYTKFGRLTYDMWRACRLVVDTGIHYYGWSREQAVEFLGNRTALSVHEVNTEINRYISWPGQALSYKIGELKIRELRQKAKTALGDHFNIREFHDLVLSEGTVTLTILEKMVDRYILEKTKS